MLWDLCSPRAYLRVCYWQVTCYDKDKDTSSDIIGEFTCTTAQLSHAKDRPVSLREPLSVLFFSLKLPFLSLFLRQVHCSDYDSDGSHDLIGVFQTNVSELQKAAHGSPVRPCIFLLALLLFAYLTIKLLSLYWSHLT